MINFDMPAFDPTRRSLMHLRPRHLLWVEELGIRGNYDRTAMQEYFCANYNSFFGPLRRPKAKEVPSDGLRKFIMVSGLLDLVDGRRAEYAQERSARSN
jgi:hypothetical protein